MNSIELLKLYGRIPPKKSWNKKATDVSAVVNANVKTKVVKNQFKELPNNIEAEQAVIGSVLVSNDIFDEISTIISSINFYDPMHQKIFEAIESLIYKGMLANPITLKNYFEDEKDDLNVPEYLVKITKFSTSVRQAVEYSKIIYDMFVRRELIKISEQTIDSAKLNDLDTNGQTIIENSERLLFDLAEKGSFNSSLVKFDEAMKQTIEMASAAYKNEEGIVGVPSGLKDLDDRLGGMHKSDLIIKNTKMNLNGILLKSGNLYLTRGDNINLKSEFSTDIKLDKNNLKSYSFFLNEIKFKNNFNNLNVNLDHVLNIKFDKTLKVLDYEYNNKGNVENFSYNLNIPKNDFIPQDIKTIELNQSDIEIKYHSDKNYTVYSKGKFCLCAFSRMS